MMTGFCGAIKFEDLQQQPSLCQAFLRALSWTMSQFNFAAMLTHMMVGTIRFDATGLMGRKVMTQPVHMH